MNRRGWFGAAAGLGAVAATASAQATADGRQQFRVGLLGLPESSGNSAAGVPNWSELGLAVTQVWDPESLRAREMADSLAGAVVASGPDTLDVDAVVVADPRAIGASERLLTPYLERGVAVWVEGPLAYSGATAKRLANVAQGPLASICLEELLPMTQTLGRLAREYAPLTVGFGSLNTDGRFAHCWSGFEAVAFGLAVFGASPKAGARIAGDAAGEHYAYVLEYAGARPMHAAVHGMPGGEDLAWARLYGKDMADLGHPAGLTADEAWLAAQLHAASALKRMIRTGTPPQPVSAALDKTQTYLACCYASVQPGGKLVGAADLPDSWQADDPFPGYLG